MFSIGFHWFSIGFHMFSIGFHRFSIGFHRLSIGFHKFAKRLMCPEVELSGFQTGRGVHRKLTQNGPPTLTKIIKNGGARRAPTIFD